MPKKNTENRIFLIIGIAILVILTPFMILTMMDRKKSIWEYDGINEANESGTSGNEATEELMDIPVEEGTVRITDDAPWGNLDIAKNSDDYFLALNVYDRLVEINEKTDGTSEIVPSLAKEWSVSPDGRTYSFTLRDDALFSDGTKLTAADVEFSLTRLLTVTDSEQTSYADMIKGADKVLSKESRTLEGIEVKDDQHLSITLEEPFPSFLSMLGTPACSILSRKSVREGGARFGIDPQFIIGSGPYMISEMDEEKCVVILNPHYWGEEPSVKKAVVYYMVSAVMDKEFRAGNLDIIDLNYINTDIRRSYIEDPVYEKSIVAKDNVEVYSFMMNVNMPPFDDVRVRKAVQLAIDRQRILDEVCDGYGETLDGIYPKGLMGYTEDNQGWLKYDPEEAKRLIKEAGVAEGEAVELVLSAVADAGTQKLTEIVQENMRAVGLNAVIVIYDSDSRMYLRRNGRVMAYLFQWMADYNDPDNFLYTLFGGTEATKRYSSNFSDKTILDRIEKARHIEDEAARMKEYGELEKILIRDEALWAPLYHSKHLYVKGDRVESFDPYWAGWSDVPLKGIKLK